MLIILLTFIWVLEILSVHHLLERKANVICWHVKRVWFQMIFLSELLLLVSDDCFIHADN